MKNNIQVITIGNAFELVHRRVQPYLSLSELSRVDERHFGQKASYWSTRYGEPDIVICSTRPSQMILDVTHYKRPLPVFVEPTRQTSSICEDLLADPLAISRLLAALDRNKKLYLAPYVHTAQFERLASLLLDSGYSLIDYRSQADLVRVLWNKVYAQHLVFESVDRLLKHRPMCSVAHSTDELNAAFESFTSNGVQKVVVKSASAVGGAGVFFVELNTAGMKHSPVLVKSGQNEADLSGPFLVEERVQCDASPTVDIEVTSTGEVEIIGIALQRLYDGRYYTGFYSSTEFQQRWWFNQIETLARVVGYKLADLGYLGAANIDFVISNAGHSITLVEVNPRRSALIDGLSLCKSQTNSRVGWSVSAADYVNIAERFDGFQRTFSGAENEDPRPNVIPVCDGGFDSSFRWVGLLAIGDDLRDSEELLDEVVKELQDSVRDEIGLAESSVKRYRRISEKVA